MQPPWPIGLRVVFWLVVFGIVVSTGLLIYYGGWALYLYAGGCLVVLFGACGLRRLFALSTTIGCLLSIVLNAYYTANLLAPFWRSAASGALNVGSLLTVEGWYITWNVICFSIAAGVVLYLLSYEYKLFGPGKMTRQNQ